MITENWKPIPNYPNYEVSDCGRVMSLIKYRPLKPFANQAGYLRVKLTDASGNRKQLSVHRLVMATFTGDCPPGKEVRHLDDNKKNNFLSNLSYGTKEENKVDEKINTPLKQQIKELKEENQRLRKLLQNYGKN